MTVPQAIVNKHEAALHILSRNKCPDRYSKRNVRKQKKMAKRKGMYVC